MEHVFQIKATGFIDGLFEWDDSKKGASDESKILRAWRKSFAFPAHWVNPDISEGNGRIGLERPAYV